MASSFSDIRLSQKIHSTLWSYLCPMMKQIDDLKSETQTLRSMVSQLQQKVDFLDRQRINTREDLDIQEKDILKSQIPSTHQFQLPNDVLRIVFLHCLPKGSEAMMKADEAPLVFGRVCSTWRRVAWSTQELWDTFQITIPPLIDHPREQQRSKCDSYLDVIEGWMRRAGQRLLCISLIDENPAFWDLTDGYREFIQRVIEAIATESARWKSIKLRLPGSFIKNHLGIDSFELPSLETIEVRNASLEFLSYQPGELDFLSNDWETTGFLPIVRATSESLRSLHLGDATMALPVEGTLGNQLNFDTFQWSNLLSLSIGTEHPANRHFTSLSVFQAHRCLQHLAESGTQLRSCRMVLKMVHIATPPYHQIYLPSLRKIAITLLGLQVDRLYAPPVEDNDIKQLFSSLKCPSLTFLLYRTRIEPIFPFFSFLQETQELKELHLYFTGTKVRIIGETIQLWQQCLKLCPHSTTDVYLATIISEICLKNINNLPPYLERIVLDCTPPMNREQIFQTYAGGELVSESVLRRTVERERYLKLQRRIRFLTNLCHLRTDVDGKLQLKEVRFRLDERLRDQALRQLAPFIAKGLRVTFKEDYYDIPPPVGLPDPLSEGLWCSPCDL